MKRTLLFVVCCLFALALAAKSVTPAASLPAYYEKIDGKSGKSLFDAVQTVTKTGYSSLGYDGLWGAYPYTDVHENGYVWDMYSDCTWKSINSNHCGNYSNECDCYNREHSIPKSWYGGSTSGPGCDIFHLVPTDGKVNGIRSNYPFGEVSSADYNKHGNKKGSAKSITITGGNTIAGNTGATISASGIVFEPRDEYKGDFARGYMGALLKWAGDKAFTEGEGSKTFTTNFSTGSFGLTKYGVALLMKWHRQDPVSKKEVDRNNGIQQTQGNRNPFIDYPYLAEYIWGEKAGQTLNLDDMITAYDSRFVLGESNGYLNGGSTPVDPEIKCTVTWLVNGEVYTTGNPTISVNEGGVVSVLPTAPKSCDEISTQFVGWSEDVINGSQDDVPSDLFSTADDAPDIMQNTTFHAVFAQLEEEETTVSTPSEVAMSLTNTQGWTLSGLIKDSKHWRMVTGAYVESPSVDASKITSITINMRTYGGATYKTIEFSMAGKKIGELSASNKNLNDYTWKPNTSLTGVGALRFTSKVNTAEFGPALSSITIQTSGGTGTTTTYTYSRYITSCNNQSTDIEETIVAKPNTKIIRNGQLLIEYNGVYYNTLGQQVQ